MATKIGQLRLARRKAGLPAVKHQKRDSKPIIAALDGLGSDMDMDRNWKGMDSGLKPLA